MKAWRARSSSGGGFAQSAAPLVAHVVSVVTDGSTAVVWTFDQIVVSIGDVTGLQVNTDGSIGVLSGLGTSVVHLDYFASHNPGEAWDFVAATAAMIFSPTAVISDDSGATT